MNRGYTGKILMVNLNDKSICEETVSDSVYEKNLAGIGLASHLLFNRIPTGADPLGPDNMLGFLPGLLTGTGSLFTGRWMVVGKSPLTGGWGDANCGGNFSPAIKTSGYDGIFFTGLSDKPLYLHVHNNNAELKDASFLWGKDAVETEETLLSIHPNARVACIGQAGEKLSLISGVSNDRGRMAARSGLGAVMGSKKIKALVVEGDQQIPVNNQEQITELNKTVDFWISAQAPLPPGWSNAYLGKLMRFLPNNLFLDGIVYKMMLKKWGTISMNQTSMEMGDAPIKNWGGTSEDFDISKSCKVNPDRIIEHEKHKYFCYSCPLGCGGICDIKGKYQTYKETHKPEYETVIALGALCLNDDMDSIFHMNEVLNRAGMDTISAGATVAFAIECYERGLITKQDTNGLELKWGNSDAIIKFVEMMVNREGIGDIFADGVKVAAKKIGKGSYKFAIHAGGQELPMHDGRNDPGFAFHYSVEPTPGRHTMGSLLYYDMFQLWQRVKSLPVSKMTIWKDTKYEPTEEKAIKAAACSQLMNVVNCAGLCLFGALMGVHRVPIFEWLNAATGWNKTPEDYMDIGKHIQTVKQSFNVKHGIEPIENFATDRALGRPPLLSGANEGRVVFIENLAENYWKQFGWNAQTGIPN